MSPIRITLFVYAYNHARFIREAVIGAFNQTYPNLEIILSDDCSTDNTFEIMKEMCEQYRGPNKVILNRNDHNLGISDHLNKITFIGSGEWFVLCAGDDISMSDRVETIVSVIDKYNDVKFISTGLDLIDETGKHLGYHGFDDFHPYITGASGAWHRSCFDAFGPITQKTTVEDAVIPFRALLSGKIALVNKPTVKYRVHSGSISNPLNNNYRESLLHLLKIREQLISACSQRILDLGKSAVSIEENTVHILEKKHMDLIDIFRSDSTNISKRQDVLQMNLSDRIKYLVRSGEGKHTSFFYRIKVFLSSYDLIRKILIREKRDPKVYSPDGSVRLLQLNDILNPSVGLLIYI